jgi:hypothetical protein
MTVTLAVAGRCRDEEDAGGGMRQTSVQQHGPNTRPTPPAGSAPPAAEVRYPFGVQNDFGQVILSGGASGARVSPSAQPHSGRLVRFMHNDNNNNNNDDDNNNNNNSSNNDNNDNNDNNNNNNNNDDDDNNNNSSNNDNNDNNDNNNNNNNDDDNDNDDDGDGDDDGDNDNNNNNNNKSKAIPVHMPWRPIGL